MKDIYFFESNFYHKLFIAGLFTLCAFVPANKIFANETATGTPEITDVIVSEIKAGTSTQVIVANEVIESTTLDVLPNTESQVDVIKKDIPKPEVLEEYKRIKIEPVKAPDHTSFEKPKAFSKLTLEQGVSIPKPKLPARTLYRLYGIVESTTTESLSTTTLPTEEIQEEAVPHNATSTETEVVSSSTPTVSTTTVIEDVADTASSTEDTTQKVELPVFTKPDDAVEVGEETL